MNSDWQLSCPHCGAFVRASAHKATCPVTAADEEMMERDRDYFDQHPGVRSYRRELMPGDLGIPTLECLLDSPGEVEVVSLGPGLRSRLLPDDLAVDLATTDGMYLYVLMNGSGD